MQDHVVHFYHLHALDWVDVVSALSANPNETSRIAQSISNWSKSSPKYFSDLQKRLTTFVESGQLGIFANGYWGHPAYKLPAEINLIGVAHYLEALEWQKELVKVHTIFGGKNPHPNYLVGGAPCSVNIDDVNAINAERLAMVGKLFKDAKDFVNQVYIPDLLAVAPYYLDWAGIGGGLENYLAYGDLPVNGFADVANFKFPRGAILNRDLSTVHEVDGSDAQQVKEFISHSWYNYSDGDDLGKHPWDGETEFNYTGPKPPYDQLNVDGKYSWLKTPRWKGNPMEVGPLARMLVGYASGREDIQEVVNSTLAKLNAPVTALFSTLGRTAARGLETILIADWALEFYDQLLSNIKNGDTRMFNNEKWEPSTWPDEAKGVGLSEAPRGALAHWIVIKNQKIDNYQLVVPSTWNASPRDAAGQMSSYEASLIGTPVADPEKPLEILRTIHSFDPCIACAVHLYDEKGTYVHQIQTF
jgi:hydrogenase large subunit